MPNQYGISKKGEFADKELEKEFFQYDMASSVPYIKPITIALGVLFMLFLLPDFFLIADKRTLITIFVIRVVFFLLILALSYSCDKFTNYGLFAVFLSVCELFAAVCFLSIYFFYESPDFLIQAMGVIVILIGIYMAPNKWIYSQLTSVTLSASFMIVSARYIEGVDISDLSAGCVYIVIVMIMCSAFSFRSNYLKRMQYVDSKELLKLSYTDPLTGSFNRTKFDQELNRWMAYSNRYKAPLSIVIFDLDNFKTINDRHGHLSGDKVMQEIAGIIRAVIRKPDVFARWGGDEFALLLPNTDAVHAMELTERLHKLIESYSFEIGDKVTCSFGIGTMIPGETADDFLRRADRFLYNAKESGKNKIGSGLAGAG